MKTKYRSIVLHSKNLLVGMGKMIKNYKHKVSFHPGQFNVLCSPKAEIVKKTIFELNQSHPSVKSPNVLQDAFRKCDNLRNPHVGL